MDTRLPWYQRLAIRLHLLYCVWCRRFAAQVRFLRKAARKLAEEEPDAFSPKLPAEAKEQMRQRLREALKHPPSSHP